MIPIAFRVSQSLFFLSFCDGLYVSYGTPAWLVIPSPRMVSGYVILCYYSLTSKFHRLVVYPCVYFSHTLSGSFFTWCSLYICFFCHPHSLVPFSPLPQISTIYQGPEKHSNLVTVVSSEEWDFRRQEWAFSSHFMSVYIVWICYKQHVARKTRQMR